MLRFFYLVARSASIVLADDRRRNLRLELGHRSGIISVVATACHVASDSAAIILLLLLLLLTPPPPRVCVCVYIQSARARASIPTAAAADTHPHPHDHFCYIYIGTARGVFVRPPLEQPTPFAFSAAFLRLDVGGSFFCCHQARRILYFSFYNSR